MGVRPIFGDSDSFLVSLFLFQLLLQSWLLSFDFLELASLDVSDIVSKALDGLIFFVTFGLKATGETEESLGKVCSI